MLYAHAKHLEMARSILPSTRRRQAAADLARLRRRNRRSVRRHLRTLTTGPLDWADHRPFRHGADPWGDVALTAYPKAEIRAVVMYERRTADKLNHFERWAVTVTAGLRPHDRLSAMRAILPGGLIGAHALSHLTWLDQFRVDEYGGWWYRRYRPAAPDAPSADELAGLVRRVLEHGGHGELNRRLVDRRLLGAHDIDSFVDHHLREGHDAARHLTDLCEAVVAPPAPDA